MSTVKISFKIISKRNQAFEERNDKQYLSWYWPVVQITANARHVRVLLLPSIPSIPSLLISTLGLSQWMAGTKLVHWHSLSGDEFLSPFTWWQHNELLQGGISMHNFHKVCHSCSQSDVSCLVLEIFHNESDLLWVVWLPIVQVDGVKSQ